MSTMLPGRRDEPPLTKVYSHFLVSLQYHYLPNLMSLPGSTTYLSISSINLDSPSHFISATKVSHLPFILSPHLCFLVLAVSANEDVGEYSVFSTPFSVSVEPKLSSRFSTSLNFGRRRHQQECHWAFLS